MTKKEEFTRTKDRRQYVARGQKYSIKLILKKASIKIIKSRLSFFLFSFSFLFLFNLFFIFRTLGLGIEVICHTVTLVTSDSVVTTLIMRLERRK